MFFCKIWHVENYYYIPIKTHEKLFLGLLQSNLFLQLLSSILLSSRIILRRLWRWMILNGEGALQVTLKFRVKKCPRYPQCHCYVRGTRKSHEQEFKERTNAKTSTGCEVKDHLESGRELLTGRSLNRWTHERDQQEIIRHG